jgi:hypothetical protein
MTGQPLFDRFYADSGKFDSAAGAPDRCAGQQFILTRDALNHPKAGSQQNHDGNEGCDNAEVTDVHLAKHYRARTRRVPASPVPFIVQILGLGQAET